MGFKEDIKRIKSKKVVDGLPKPVEKAVSEFLEQAVLLVENDYEYIDNKYLDNLLTTLNQYPEYRPLLYDLLNILGINIQYGEA